MDFNDRKTTTLNESGRILEIQPLLAHSSLVYIPSAFVKFLQARTVLSPPNPPVGTTLVVWFAEAREDEGPTGVIMMIGVVLQNIGPTRAETSSRHGGQMCSLDHQTCKRLGRDRAEYGPGSEEGANIEFSCFPLHFSNSLKYLAAKSISNCNPFDLLTSISYSYALLIYTLSLPLKDLFTFTMGATPAWRGEYPRKRRNSGFRPTIITILIVFARDSWWIHGR